GRDSTSPEDTVKEDFDTDVLADIKADATVVEVAVDRDVDAGVNAGYVSTTYIHPKSCRNISANPGEYKDEFERRTTILGVTLITAIGGLWQATSPNL
nr:hypothetical protein [Tanacetum cinerariifolium]